MADSARNTVQSVVKAFAVLRAFNAAAPELTITEVAAVAGLDRGTAFRLIHTLVELGYLATVPGTRRAWLTFSPWRGTACTRSRARHSPASCRA